MPDDDDMAYLEYRSSKSSNNSGNSNHLKIVWKLLNNISGKHDIKELQKTATLGTVHILQKTLM
jgi:hypothetical protein